MTKPNKDGWIRHRGGKCPLPLGQLVQVRKRNGYAQYSFDVSKWGDLCEESTFWKHIPEDGGNDIMAYKLLEGPPPPHKLG